MELSSQLSWLHETLLTKVKTPFPDPLSPDEKAALAAYLVLSHACIEELLEDAFARRLDFMVEIAEHEEVIPSSVANYALNAAIGLPPDRRATYKKRRLHGVLLAAAKHYKSAVIDQNHGIKRHNLVKLAEAVGLDWEDFESDQGEAIADLATLGAKRGEVGHLSPFTEKSTLLTARIDTVDAVGWVEAAAQAFESISNYLDEDLVVPYLD